MTRLRIVLGSLLAAACGASPSPPPVASAPAAPSATSASVGAPGAGVAQGALAAPGALTPDRAVHFRRISDVHFSPDGSRLAMVVSDAPDPGPESHVWVADLRAGGGEELRRFTSSAKSEKAPQWSPDGKTLALLSSRGGDWQVYTMPIDGGEATALTHLDGGVSEFRWSPDGARLAALARGAGKEAASDAEVSDREQDLERVWLVERASGKARQLTSGAYRIDSLVWPTADRLLAVATDHPRVEAWNTAIYSVDLRTGAMTLRARPDPPFSELTPSPGGARLAFAGTATGGPIPHDLFVQPLAGGPATDVSRALDRGVLEVHWQDERHPVVRVAQGFRNVLYRLDVEGKAPPSPVELPLAVRAFDVARDGTVAYVGVAFNHLPELYLQAPSGRARRLGRVQDAAWDRVPLAGGRLLHVRSFDGTDIEAALLEPRAASAGKRPLVLLVHGGPSSNFSSDYFWFNAWAQLLVARGFAVVMPNPRGSTGYGEAFLRANRGDWGGGDYKDVMAVVDSLVASGAADPARLGIGGWSYGGEMSAWAIGHTTRFKAAVIGACVYDQAAEFETEDDPAGDEWTFGTPWEHPDVYARNSPSTFIGAARTPALIVGGDADRANPVGQSRGLYRALKHLGVEAELVVYPGEPHGPRKAAHQIDIMERMLRWYEDHLR